MMKKHKYDITPPKIDTFSFALGGGTANLLKNLGITSVKMQYKGEMLNCILEESEKIYEEEKKR